MRTSLCQLLNRISSAGADVRGQNAISAEEKVQLHLSLFLKKVLNSQSWIVVEGGLKRGLDTTAINHLQTLSDVLDVLRSYRIRRQVLSQLAAWVFLAFSAGIDFPLHGPWPNFA
jgi:hypothetical protein